MNYVALISAIASAHDQALAGAAGAVNRHLILRNWLIGAYLVEFEQAGEDRAKYGTSLLKRVATDLRARDISGCAVRMLERMRVLYLSYPQLREAIPSPLATISRIPAAVNKLGISPPAVTKLTKTKTGPRGLPVQMLLQLSWTHLVDLLAIDDPWKRAFYENECLKDHWSKR